MLYASSPTLTGLGYVVMDEVHYLADRIRGGVWEEVIIHLPESVRLVSLSATVSNAEEFADWLVTVRGETTVIVEEHRPVPLWQHMMVGPRMYDMFIADGPQLKVNPELARVTGNEERRVRAVDRSRSGNRGDRRPRRRDTPSRVDVIERLDAEGLLPAITFIFSRAGCEGAVVQCLRAGVRLNTPAEAAEVRAIVEERTTSIPEEDLHILGYHEWLEALQRGIAAHHAGMLPDVQGSRRGAVHARPGEGGLRDRDPRARHQHAGAHRGAREAGEVERRGTRRRDTGRVHPAHGSRRSSWHRRRGPCRRAVDARPRSGDRRRAGVDPYVSAAFELPAVVQHGGQSGRASWPRQSSSALGVVVRAVPGRPRGRRLGPADSEERRSARRLSRGDVAAISATSRSTQLCAASCPTSRPSLPEVRRCIATRGGGCGTGEAEAR